jgi:hypothetical protein
MAITKITLTNTGRYNFHDAPDIVVHVRPEQFDPVHGDTIYLTASQERRIYQHFCGIGDCCCGSRPDNMEYVGPNEAILHV